MDNKVSIHKYDNNIQRPINFWKFSIKIFKFLGFVSLSVSVLAILMKDTEITLLFGGLALFFFIFFIFYKHLYNTSYQENTEYFILTIRNKEYKVFYENIIDWAPSFNEIKILDQTKSDKKYIRVNIKYFKPEILLGKLVDMAFDGKFTTINPNDPNREIDTVYYLVENEYGYLVEDYVDKIENKYQRND